jgi:hypothetical protein
MRSQTLHDHHHGSDPGSNLGERLLQEAGMAERACTQLALLGRLYFAVWFENGAMCVKIVDSIRQTSV